MVVTNPVLFFGPFLWKVGTLRFPWGNLESPDWSLGRGTVRATISSRHSAIKAKPNSILNSEKWNLDWWPYIKCMYILCTYKFTLHSSSPSNRTLVNLNVPIRDEKERKPKVLLWIWRIKDWWVALLPFVDTNILCCILLYKHSL